MLQEALQNVSSHAEATNASVIVSFTDELLQLNVKDNGRGFDLQAVETDNAGHLGLLGMRERAESLGGQLHIDTCPGGGTSVVLKVPLTTAVTAETST